MDMVREGAILIDAGTSEAAGKLAGDIDPACADKAALYTPVPGGVGPVTVAKLFENLVTLVVRSS
jgi:methylenetetrahydrofolate dehydrogenase (NADP+)/methenyltetrahydrofolate cyclohydrolase